MINSTEYAMNYIKYDVRPLQYHETLVKYVCITYQRTYWLSLSRNTVYSMLSPAMDCEAFVVLSPRSTSFKHNPEEFKY